MRWLSLGTILLRACLAAGAVYLCLQDWPALRARYAFDLLPEIDFAAEAQRLRTEERYAEALLVIEAGLDDAQPAQAKQLQGLRTDVEQERDDWLRRLREAGSGAWTGQGDSVESLAGALAADLLVFGDVRDLVIQGGRAVTGQETDEVLVALSVAGLLLTVTPSLDLGAALLKFARRAGALTNRFASSLLRLARGAAEQKSIAPIAQVLEDAASLGRSARPAGAVAILRGVEDASELRLAAKFAQRQRAGAFALWSGGPASLRWLKAGGNEALLLRAARKGRAGVESLAANGKLLLRTHPLLGLVKGLYKGNLQELLWKLFPRFGEWLLGLACAWLMYELVRLGARASRPRQRAFRSAR